MGTPYSVPEKDFQCPSSLVGVQSGNCHFCDKLYSGDYNITKFRIISDFNCGWQYCDECEQLMMENEKKYLQAFAKTIVIFDAGTKDEKKCTYVPVVRGDDRYFHIYINGEKKCATTWDLNSVVVDVLNNAMFIKCIDGRKSKFIPLSHLDREPDFEIDSRAYENNERFEYLQKLKKRTTYRTVKPTNQTLTTQPLTTVE